MMKAFSCVQLLTDKYQSEGANRFDIGYIIDLHPNNKYEVEFSDPDGITTAQIVAGENELQLARSIPVAPKPNATVQRTKEQ